MYKCELYTIKDNSRHVTRTGPPLGPVWQLATPLSYPDSQPHGTVTYIKGDAACSSYNTLVVSWHR